MIIFYSYTIHNTIFIKIYNYYARDNFLWGGHYREINSCRVESLAPDREHWDLWRNFLAAQSTLMGSLSCVLALVDGEIVLVKEPLATVGALVRHLSCVCKTVTCQRRRVTESLVALSALIRLLPAVRAHVSTEIALVLVPPATLSAPKRPLPAVKAHVNNKIAHVSETLAAQSALMGHVSCM